MKAARARGVKILVVTNSLAASDEPVVNTGYQRYRVEMLQAGVRLYEMTSLRMRHVHLLRAALGSASGRLHAKLAIIDRRRLMFGSMNLDPRSALTNSEIGVDVLSPELTSMVIKAYQIDDQIGATPAAYEVRLQPDGHSLEWVARDVDRDGRTIDQQIEYVEPESTWFLRMRERVLSWIVPESLL